MSAHLGVMLRDVSVRRGRVWALRDVSLEFKAGERWALIGGNGAGKTQLLKLVSADVWPTPTGRGARTYRIGRRGVDAATAKERIAYLGAELQDKYARYGWNLEVADVLTTGLHRTDLLLRPASAADRRKVAAMLERCGIGELRGRRFLALSYGQKRIVLLARALIGRPHWLLLDEFYNGLDVAFRRRVDVLLAHAARHGQAWIAAAHRAADVPRATRGVIELDAGRVRRVARLDRGVLARLKTQAAETRTAHPAVPRSAPPRRRVESRTVVGRAGGGHCVRITHADLYVEHREVLRGVNWELRRGDHWAVLGANGAGKSSLLKLLYGDLSPALGGRIERRGFARGSPIADWKRRIGYVSPELQTDYAVDVSVRDLVASGRYASIGLCDPPTAADLRIARRWLRFFGLLSFAGRRPRELSYGQLRRALIARALAADPRLLLLDEPLTGLDPRQRARMKGLLGRLMARRITVVIAVHHPEDLPPGITRALHLESGRAVERDVQSATSVRGEIRRGR